MGKKDSKDLKKQAKNIQIVVTSDNEVEEDSNEEVPEIKVVKKKTSKCLAFDDKIDKVEYNVDGDAFHQAIKSPPIVNNGKSAVLNKVPNEKLKLHQPKAEEFNANYNEPIKGEILNDIKITNPPSEPKNEIEDDNISRKSFGRYGSFSSLKRYTSKTSLISAYDFIKEKVVPDSMRKKPDETKLRLVVAFFFLVIVFVISLAQILYVQHKGEKRIFGNVKFEEHHRTVTVFDVLGNKFIEGHIGAHLPHDDHHYDCKGHQTSETEKCLEWHRKSKLTIKHSQNDEFGINCYNMFWQSLHSSVSPMDCLSFGEEGNPIGHWYGGGENLQVFPNKAWPLEKGHIEKSPFITGDEGQTEWGNTIRKYFANSNGVVVTIDDDTPLYVSIDHHHGLCLEARFDDFAYFNHRYQLPTLNYTICTDGQGDLKNLHQHFLPKTFWDGHSQNDMSTLKSVLKKPLWQVPATEGLTHDKLKNYLNLTFPNVELSEKATDRGYLLLDYHWQKNMGDFKFNEIDFPNVSETIKMVNQTGLKLVLTINPYISTNSENFGVGVEDELFVKERNSTAYKVPALTWIKDVASAGLLDITSNNSVKWLKSALKNLKKLDSENILFNLDTGNTFHMPTYYKFAMSLDNPDMFRDYFVKHCMSEVSVIGVSGASTKRPKAPAFIFLSPLESNWKSLRSIIPNMLQLSVVGYPFVNPGPVGGVGTFKNKQAGNLEKEEEADTEEEKNDQIDLYIRWWQLNVFLPMLHFIKPPTSFPENKIAKVASYLKKVRDRKSVV